MNWTDPEFIERALDWIQSHVEVIAEIEQRQVQSWSTVIRVTSRSDVFWFKATADPMSFEPSLIALLGQVRPDRVPELAALDVDRGWMLMHDAGKQLRELIHSADDLWRLEEYLPEYADLQLAVAPLVDELLELGVPDEHLLNLPGRIEQMLDSPEMLMLGMPGGLSPDEVDRLREALPEMSALCDEIAGDGITETIQHDDLNDGNVMFRKGRYRTMDWGDSCVSHPFHTLTVTLRATAYRLDLEPGGPEVQRLRDSYLEPFSAASGMQDLRRTADLAYRTGTLARAHFWFRTIGLLSLDRQEEDLEAVPYGLRMFLEDGPIGSWR